jgi:hypothetical protein
VAEARKFNIGFTLANQNLEQLREFRTYTGYHEQRLINAIFGNVGNLIVFGVGAFDARVLSDQLSVAAQDIMRIGRYQALAKLLVNGYDTTPFTLYPEEAIRRENPRNIAVIEDRMREGGYWIDPTKVREDISGRLDRVIDKANEYHEPGSEMDTEWLRARIAKAQEPLATDDCTLMKRNSTVMEELTGHDSIEEHTGTLPPKAPKQERIKQPSRKPRKVAVVDAMNSDSGEAAVRSNKRKQRPME